MKHTTGNISVTCKWCGKPLNTNEEINYHLICWIQFQAALARREAKNVKMV